MKLDSDFFYSAIHSSLLINAAWIIRGLTQALLVGPATLFFAGCLIYSFTGEGRGIAEIPHEFYSYISKLPKATAKNEGHLVIERCLDDRGGVVGGDEHQEIPKPQAVICQSWGEQEVSIDELAIVASKFFMFAYSILVVISMGLMFLFQGPPQIPTKQQGALPA